MFSYSIHSALTILFYTLLLFDTSRTAKQKIYYGELDLFHQLLNYTSQWTYVQQNVDGFYVNFLQLLVNMKPDDLRQFSKIFRNTLLYYESDADPKHQALDTDKAEIMIFHNASWNISYTSQNYGWTVERDQILAYYNLTEPVSRRPDFVQIGPWAISGNILNDPGTGPYSNAQFRAWINQSDGVSTDGPMGLWQINFQQMREGSYSLVQYARRLGRTSAIMICPYGAGVSSYDSIRDFLTVGISAMQEHEDNDADPDIWMIYEYGDSVIPAVPEQVNGRPANTTSGMAYYALKHRDGEPETLDLYMHQNNIGQYRYKIQSTELDLIVSLPIDALAVNHTVHIADYSEWLDYAACIRAFNSSNIENGWKIQYLIDDIDITTAITSHDGFIFVRDYRIRPKTVQSILISITSTSTMSVNGNTTLTIELAPHRGSAIVDSLQILLSAK